MEIETAAPVAGGGRLIDLEAVSEPRPARVGTCVPHAGRLTGGTPVATNRGRRQSAAGVGTIGASFSVTGGQLSEGSLPSLMRSP